jgi:hypothetical protein
MDAEGTCFFDNLPYAMRDSFLQQAFKLLDQHHRLQVVPLVCHLWRELVPSTCSSLEVKVRNEVAAKCLASWLDRYHTPLESIDLDLRSYCFSTVAEADKLLQVVCSKASLLNLSIGSMNARESITRLPSLTQLTSLTMLSLDLRDNPCTSLVLPTQLRHLDLRAWDARDKFAWLGDVVGSLTHCTTLVLDVVGGLVKPQHLLPLTTLHSLMNLELRRATVQAEGIAVLRKLPITYVELDVNHGDLGEICSWLKRGRSLLTTLDMLGDAGDSLQEAELLLSHLCTFAPQLRGLGVFCMQVGHSTSLAGLTQLTRLGVIMDSNDVGMRSLQALTGLRDLEIDTNKRTGAAGWPFECLASSLQRLTSLVLPDPSTDEYDDAALAYKAANQAFGSRVIKSSYACGLELKPAVPAGE